MLARSHLRIVLVALLIVSAVLFAVGVTVERSQPSHPAAAEAAERSTGGQGGHEALENAAESATEEGPGEAGSEASEAPHAGEGNPDSSSRSESESETVPGLNPDSTVLVVAAVVASLVLAGAVWHFPGRRMLLLVVAVAALSFGAFDIAEAVHQSSEGRAGLVALAALVAALHVAAAVVAFTMRGKGEDPRGRAEPQAV
jgi:uncharacterized membrane protein